MLSTAASGLRRDQLKRIGFWFLACSLILAVRIFTLGDNVQLTLEMSSPVVSTAQLFYDTGAGYREIDSITAPLRTSVPGAFVKLTFTLPDTFNRLRFDPLTTAGNFVLKNMELRTSGAVLPILPQQIKPLNQIESRVEDGNEVVFRTTPGANDPSLLIDRNLGSEVRHLKRRHAFQLFFIALPLLLVCALLVFLINRQISSGGLIGRAFANLNATFAAVAKRLSIPAFIPFDSGAMWFYAVCGVVFLSAGLMDLNGSSAGMYSSVYGHGVRQQPWLGAPRPVRSDEWAYVTPDILNQSLRSARFDARDSELGGHFAALTGNIPVRHVSTLFRPQLWPFFLLPVDYAYAFNWQFKALILLTGVFTWLLLITGSTRWAAIGALWYFFSPFTQWSYSWASALPEMIGSLCFAVVLACFLTVGRNPLALALGSLAFATCSINFAMCAYPPHMVPLFWLAALFFASWCIGHRRQILTREDALPRSLALLAAALVIAALGALVYSDLYQTIVAVANTVYPGRRVYSGGAYPHYAPLAHFLEWTERDNHFPPALVNVSEGSGFLWLAPATLFAISRMQFSRTQRFYCVALWITFCFLFAWLILPIPARFGLHFGLGETAGARMLPALGLANVAIVTLSLAVLRPTGDVAAQWRYAVGAGLVAAAAMLLILRATNANLAFFFSRGELLFAAAAAGLLIALLLSGRKSAFALCLLLPQALLFATVNPLQRGLPVFLSSDLLTFVTHHPELRDGEWIVFSDSVATSGFVAATGCQVYTGTRYLPDIDHFSLFAANGYDVQKLNRGGYLIAHLRKADEPAQIELPDHLVMQWDLTPSDPILKKLGIKYVALDQPLPPAQGANLIPLAPAAVDGFWLYRLPL